MRTAKLSINELPDTLGFVRICQIDVDNLVFMLKVFTELKEARYPTTILNGEKLLARPLLLLKCLCECLEKYFKVILIATDLKKYPDLGSFNHGLRSLWKALPERIELENGFIIRPKQELREFGIGVKRIKYDLIDLDYGLLRYEGIKNPNKNPRGYSVEVSLKKLFEAARQIDYNLTLFRDTLLGRQRKITKRIPWRILKKKYKAFHKIRPDGDMSNPIEAVVSSDRFRIRTIK